MPKKKKKITENIRGGFYEVRMRGVGHAGSTLVCRDTHTRDGIEFLVYVSAPSDLNGNPRRGYICYDGDGNVIDFIEEGYLSHGCIRGFVQVPVTGRIDITYGAFRELMTRSRSDD